MSELIRLGKDYLSSSSEDEEQNETKRKTSSCPKNNLKKLCQSPINKFDSATQKLPVPKELLTMFSDRNDDETDNPDEHDGRLRSFPHERGNWVTHIYIACVLNESFSSLVENLLANCKDIHPTREFHISLSKTVVLQYHWINSFVVSLKKKLESFGRSTIYFDTVELYLNEEKSRTFLSLKVSANEFLNRLVEKVNDTLEEFHLSTFYKEPSFHITIGWCLGNQIQHLNKTLPCLEELFNAFCKEDIQRLPFIKVDVIQCKSGNKLFTIPLM